MAALTVAVLGGAALAGGGPAAAAASRGGEMLGTLLEASPPGRRWPSPRDARALVIGGLTGRDADN